MMFVKGWNEISLVSQLLLLPMCFCSKQHAEPALKKSIDVDPLIDVGA